MTVYRIYDDKEELILRLEEQQCPMDKSYYGGVKGTLPPCGDLASPYVPAMEPLPDRYAPTEALSNGTLFPSLNLPFHLMVNGREVPKTALTELQALEFVVGELGLYLDTHPEDEEAFYVYKQYVELERTARAAYVAEHGPLYQSETVTSDTYTWVSDPWPWQFKG